MGPPVAKAVPVKAAAAAGKPKGPAGPPPAAPVAKAGMAACRAVPCRVMSACYGRVPLRAVSSKSQPRVMPCHVTHFLPLVRAVSWRVMTFKWRVMACRVMACHVPLRAVACRVISMRFEVEICRG